MPGDKKLTIAIVGMKKKKKNGRMQMVESSHAKKGVRARLMLIYELEARSCSSLV